MLILKSQDHIFFVVNITSTIKGIVFESWFTLIVYTSQFHTFQVNNQSLQWNVCAHVNCFFSNLVEFVDFSDLRGVSVGWFISFSNNIGLKCLFVRCRKYHKSRWKGAAELHILVEILCGTTAAELLHNSVDLLCGTTAAEPLHNSIDLLCGTTAAGLLNHSVDLLCGTTVAEQLHNSVDLLCGATAAELNNPLSLNDAYTRSSTHFPKTVTNHAENMKA